MQHVEITPTKTYKTASHAHIAVARKINPSGERAFGEIRYIVCTHTDGRFYPLFIGINAVHYGIHFHFNVIA